MLIKRGSILDIRKSVAKPSYYENDIRHNFFAANSLIITHFVKDIRICEILKSSIKI